MFERVKNSFKKFFVLPEPNRMYITFRNGSMYLDIDAYLDSPEGKETLKKENALTKRLISEGKIVELTNNRSQV